MEKVQGIGGIFFRAKDPDAMKAWYAEHLGINPAPTDMDMQPWRTTEGVVVFAPFAADTDYYPADKQVMVNFRVGDLARMVAQLRDAGIEVFNETEMEGLGKFAHLRDPEGNPIELWEPEG
ncbi:MAG: VOC family protein [Silicimonas sp.]|nr:VOC family protein [Silicimonas sp.]NNL73661.1 VOC family protein [Silicimonas sp.]